VGGNTILGSITVPTEGNVSKLIQYAGVIRIILAVQQNMTWTIVKLQTISSPLD
jgi:hypothetical protein